MQTLVLDVLNALKNDVELNKLVAGKVYWIRPADNPKPPYITFFEVSNSTGQAADDDEYSSDIEIQVDIWTTGSYLNIQKEVHRIMKSMGFLHTSLPDQYEKDTQIIHKAIQFSIFKEV